MVKRGCSRKIRQTIHFDMQVQVLAKGNFEPIRPTSLDPIDDGVHIA
jgi:hypothetical protein